MATSAKAQTIVITGKKNMLQKGTEPEKKSLAQDGIEPTAEMVNYSLSTWF